MFVWCLCVCVQYLIHVVCLHGFQVAFIYAKLEFRDELDLFSPAEEMNINALLFYNSSTKKLFTLIMLKKTFC